MKSAFDLSDQQSNLRSKLVVGLERMTEVFKVLLWEQAKATGLSPIQIQILIFVKYHKPGLCKVSYLAKEYNVTKPTISDAVRVLLKKNLIEKKDAGGDSRSYIIGLTQEGQNLISDVDQYAAPLGNQLTKLDDQKISELYQSLTTLITQLSQSGILSVQRTCKLCAFYDHNSDGHYCNYLNEKLRPVDIRMDCPEFESKPD